MGVFTRTPWGALLDASIYFSFDASGFRRHARSFAPGDLDVDMSGKRCLITGANSGIGFATAEALARRGAEVWLLCRNPERGRAAERELRERTGNEQVRLSLLDVSDLDGVRGWVDDFAPASVDVLVHNAGVLPHERRLTSAGLETTFATHVAGPFLLTRLLRSRLEASPCARVIWVSSGGMYPQRLSLDDVDWSRRRYDGTTAYAQTKRMQVVLSELFAEAWKGKVCSNAMHPGWADTPAVRSSLPGFWKFTRKRLRTAAEGADTVVWLAVADRPGRESGRFWFDRVARSTCLLPRTRERPSDRAALWSLCERVTDCSPAQVA
ncbi:MAG: SDR family NAD(P)-dependent oxidoreductase [Planctomycetota bacterium]|jgi:NAD(P)-dependent dehydrogenase (short-subunit alcohol dehydrogenase family)